jgi:hypothetical protein
MKTLKQILLNKCEDEFNKQNINKDLNVEEKEYEKRRASCTEKGLAEKEEELELRRKTCRKRVMGNIKFSKCLGYILRFIFSVAHSKILLLPVGEL